MKDIDKLRVLIPHWIAHNGEHAEEFQSWAAKAGPASKALVSAAELVADANAQLERALAELGGPLETEDGREPVHPHHN
jgi:hypothetical protein